jgi:hypothetical protein
MPVACLVTPVTHDAARYVPKSWAERSSVNRSPDAAAIEHLLNQTITGLPELSHRTIGDVAQV